MATAPAQAPPPPRVPPEHPLAPQSPPPAPPPPLEVQTVNISTRELSQALRRGRTDLQLALGGLLLPKGLSKDLLVEKGQPLKELGQAEKRKGHLVSAQEKYRVKLKPFADVLS